MILIEYYRNNQQDYEVFLNNLVKGDEEYLKNVTLNAFDIILNNQTSKIDNALWFNSLKFIISYVNNLLDNNMIIDWFNKLLMNKDFKDIILFCGFISSYYDICQNKNLIENWIWNHLNEFINIINQNNYNSDTYILEFSYFYYEFTNKFNNNNLLNLIIENIIKTKKYHLFKHISMINYLDCELKEENMKNLIEIIYMGILEIDTIINFILNYKYDFFYYFNFGQLVDFSIKIENIYHKTLLFELIYSYLLIDEEYFINKTNQQLLFSQLLEKIILYFYNLKEIFDYDNFNEISDIIIIYYYKNLKNYNNYNNLNNIQIIDNMYIKFILFSFYSKNIRIDTFKNCKKIIQNNYIDYSNDYYKKLLIKTSKHFPSLIYENNILKNSIFENDDYNLSLKIIYNFLKNDYYNDLFLNFILNNLNNFTLRDINKLKNIIKLKQFDNEFYIKFFEIISSYNNSSILFFTPIIRFIIRLDIINHRDINMFRVNLEQNNKFKNQDIIILIYESSLLLKEFDKIKSLEQYILKYFNSISYNVEELTVYIKLYLIIDKLFKIDFNFNLFILNLINDNNINIDSRIIFFNFMLKNYINNIFQDNNSIYNFEMVINIKEFLVKYLLDEEDYYFITETFFNVYKLFFKAVTLVKQNFENLFHCKRDNLIVIYQNILIIYSKFNIKNSILKMNVYEKFIDIFIDAKLIFDNTFDYSQFEKNINYTVDYMNNYDANKNCLKIYKYII